ncbi:hypothetical protein ASPCAL14279 [Aspergillus calidoustus]|uniref:Uncharacterized protein n=1 Tax=Aspergillus calidoustus TaxID=454130 RepID=A0A0U5GIF3_ASPCI|nr:hypothetical protein ASPCAL14279 [Aspergillus calidoustus]
MRSEGWDIDMIQCLSSTDVTGIPCLYSTLFSTAGISLLHQFSTSYQFNLHNKTNPNKTNHPPTKQTTTKMPLFHRDHRDSMSSSSRSSMEDPNMHHSSKGGIFGSRRRTSASGYSSASSTGSHRNSGTYGHNSRHSGSGSGFGFMNRNRRHEDPAIASARDRVFAAEEAERAADQALYASRRAVQEARNDVRNLEKEAKEDARAAKFKQSQAKDISKRVKPLGRK